MILAGLYNECATAADPSDITWRFALVSTNANPEMMWLKNRQPVILSTEADVKAWLDVSSGTCPPGLFEILRAHDHQDQTRKLTWYVLPQSILC